MSAHDRMRMADLEDDQAREIESVLLARATDRIACVGKIDHDSREPSEVSRLPR